MLGVEQGWWVIQCFVDGFLGEALYGFIVYKGRAIQDAVRAFRPSFKNLVLVIDQHILFALRRGHDAVDVGS